MTDAPREITEADGVDLDFECAITSTQERVQHLLESSPQIIRRLTAHLAKSEGKHIRARALLSCAAREDGMIGPGAVSAAASIELLHLATLVHDDIIDDAAKRRGIKTLHRKFGRKAAVLCGDYLLSMALELAMSIRPQGEPHALLGRALPSYLSEICLGEMLQDQNNHNLRLSERTYFKIISGKTAALFEASYHIGYVLSGEPEERENTYVQIGKNTGLIFQLCDDCADYESAQKETNKPVLSDFRQGVITLPLIYALKKDRQLRENIGRGIKPQMLKAAVTKAGGLEYTRQKISELCTQTEELILSLDTAQEKKRRLTLILKKSAGIDPSVRMADKVAPV